MTNFNTQSLPTGAYITTSNSIIASYIVSSNSVAKNIANSGPAIEIVPLRIRPVNGQVYPRFT